MPPLDNDALAAMNESTPSDADLENLPDPANAPPPDADNTQDPPVKAADEITKDSAPAGADEKGKGEEPENEQDPEGAKNRNLIARHRYNYQKQQRDLAEARAAELEQRLQAINEENQRLKQAGQQPQQSVSDVEAKISDLDTKIEEARADGDAKEAARLRGEQRRLEQSLVAYTLQSRQQTPPNELALAQRASDNLRLEQTIFQLERQFPMLEEGNEKFDAEMSSEVMDLYDVLVQKLPPAAAMNRSVAYVTSAHGVVPATAENPDLRTTNVARNAKAAAAQPPDLSEAGRDSNTAGASVPLDVMTMSQDDFEKLGDQQIEKLLNAM